MGILQDSGLEALLAPLHHLNETQLASMVADHQKIKDAGIQPNEAQIKQYMSDKLVALDRDKSEFCYQLCRAMNARRIVEAGTSFGVSTVYLAAAVRDNIRDHGGGSGTVIATEYETGKAASARKLFEEAQLHQLIDLRVGDLRDTLRQVEAPIDFMLIDIWIDMARPALELVMPALRKGSVVICDNTEIYRSEYAGYLEFLRTSGLRTMTLPFKGGLEMAVRC